MTPRLGAAFWIKAQQAVPRHLWVVVSKPNADGAVVIVNFTTARSGSDRSCVIQAKEHPDVDHETVVAYQLGEWLDASRFAHLQNVGALQLRQSVSPPLLRRIQDGALQSRFTRQAHQDLVRATLDAPS